MTDTPVQILSKEKEPVTLEELNIENLFFYDEVGGYATVATFIFCNGFSEEEGQIILVNSSIEGLLEDIKKFGNYLQDLDCNKRVRLFALLHGLSYYFDSKDTIFNPVFNKNIISILPEITLEEVISENEIDNFIMQKVLEELSLPKDTIDLLLNSFEVSLQEFSIDVIAKNFNLLVYAFNCGWSYFRISEEIKKKMAKES